MCCLTGAEGGSTKLPRRHAKKSQRLRKPEDEETTAAAAAEGREGAEGGEGAESEAVRKKGRAGRPSKQRAAEMEEQWQAIAQAAGAMPMGPVQTFGGMPGQGPPPPPPPPPPAAAAAADEDVEAAAGPAAAAETGAGFEVPVQAAAEMEDVDETDARR